MIQNSYVQTLALKGVRVDGRKFDQYRDVHIEYGISQKSAEGSARVKIGDTEVVAGVKLEIGTPFPDKPDEGSIMVNVELLPLSSPNFESGPPSEEAIEFSRVTDRGIRECHALNFKKLCVTEGEKVWLAFIDIYPINADGNLFDACMLAAMAALRDAKFPALEDGKVNYSERTNKALPMERLPMSCTVWKVKDALLVDPLPEEEQSATARLTVVLTEDNKICAMQKGGVEPFTTDEVMQIIDLAKKKTEELRRFFQ